MRKRKKLNANPGELWHTRGGEEVIIMRNNYSGIVYQDSHGNFRCCEIDGRYFSNGPDEWDLLKRRGEIKKIERKCISMNELAGTLLDIQLKPYREMNKASNGRFFEFLGSKDGQDVLCNITQRVNATVGIKVSKEDLLKVKE